MSLRCGSVCLTFGIIGLWVTGCPTTLHARETGGAPADQGAAALQKGETLAAIERYTTALKAANLTNDRRASLLNDRAVAFMRLGQSKEAIEDFNAAAKSLPEYAAIYNNRGNLLLSLGLIKEAIKDFDRALVLAPGYAAAYNNRAGAFVNEGDWKRAIADYTQAVKLAPANPAPMSGRGRAHLQLGRPYSAIRDFTRALNSDARFAVAYRQRAEAQLQLQQYDMAIEDLSRAIAFDVNNPSIYLVRGRAYLETKNLASALKDFSRAIEVDANFARAFESRGLAFAFAGALDEAFRDLNRALELDPRSSAAFAFRAFAYKQNDQAEIGAQDIETAKKLNPENADVLWANAEIREALGDPDKAIADLRKALQLRPGMPKAVEALQRLGLGVEPERLVGNPTPDGWQIVLQNNHYFAINESYPRFRVPLELWGPGKPSIIGWEVREEPFPGIGVLRFESGAVDSPSGKVRVAQAAILDLHQHRIVAIELDRQGENQSQWSWSNGKLTVASIDGATDEFVLRSGQDMYASQHGRRRYSEPYGSDGWTPWGQSWAGDYQRERPPQRRRRKPKSIFDLLFN